MKTRKNAFLALIALALSGGMIFFGCELFQPEPTPNAITFKVTAYTPSGQNTESLDIKFSAEVEELKASDITLTLSNPTYVEKGNLTGSGTDWKLDIMVKSPFAGTIDCKVTVSKSGVNSTAQSVEGGGIVNNVSKADYDVTSSGVDPSTNTAKLTIVPTKAVTIYASEITLINDTGTANIVTFTPPPSGSKSYVLDVSVTKPGKIKVKISNNAQVNDAEKEVELAIGAPTPGTGVLVSKITIWDEKLAYSTLVDENQVEKDYPKQLSVVIHPSDAAIKTVKWESLDPDIVTVNEKGVISAGPNKQKRPYDNELKTTIYAKSTDGSEVTGEIEITVVDTKEPTEVKIDQVTSDSEPDYAIKLETNNMLTNFYMGNKETILTVYLADGEATNDQSMQKPTVSNESNLTLVTVTPLNDLQDTKNSVPYKQFKIKPADYKADLNGKKGTITFSSTSDITVTTSIEFTLTYKEVSDFGEGENKSTISFTDESGEEITGTDFDFKDNSTIIVTVTPDAPYPNNGITFTHSPNNKVYISNYGNNQWKITNRSLSSETVTISCNVKDVRGKEVTKTFTVKKTTS